jgi:hypothetical protein
LDGNDSKDERATGNNGAAADDGPVADAGKDAPVIIFDQSKVIISQDKQQPTNARLMPFVVIYVT